MNGDEGRDVGVMCVDSADDRDVTVSPTDSLSKGWDGMTRDLSGTLCLSLLFVVVIPARCVRSVARTSRSLVSTALGPTLELGRPFLPYPTCTHAYSSSLCFWLAACRAHLENSTHRRPYWRAMEPCRHRSATYLAEMIQTASTKDLNLSRLQCADNYWHLDFSHCSES